MPHLLLIDDSSNLIIADPDNGVRMPIGAKLEPIDRSTVLAAAWSHAGQWTTWSVGSDALDGVRELRIHDEATDTASVLAEATAPFYMNPSPCGRYVSHLSAGPLGLELAVTDVRSGAMWLVERGQPLFWSWSVDGNHLAIHVADRVAIAEVSGAPVCTLTDTAGGFTTPWWLSTDSIAFVLEDRIVSGSVDGLSSPLLDHGSLGRFAVAPDRRRLASVEHTGSEPKLAVFDLLTHERVEVTDRPTVAFFWSPTGERLAALVVDGTATLRWCVFDGTDLVALAPFRPSKRWLATMITFFEQYAQSNPCWSVDGTRLVAPALDDEGHSGALVQDATGGGETLWLPDAEVAWWA